MLWGTQQLGDSTKSSRHYKAKPEKVCRLSPLWSDIQAIWIHMVGCILLSLPHQSRIACSRPRRYWSMTWPGGLQVKPFSRIKNTINVFKCGHDAWSRYHDKASYYDKLRYLIYHSTSLDQVSCCHFRHVTLMRRCTLPCLQFCCISAQHLPCLMVQLQSANSILDKQG